MHSTHSYIYIYTAMFDLIYGWEIWSLISYTTKLGIFQVKIHICICLARYCHGYLSHVR